MSRTLPHDPALAEAEQRRLQELKTNGAYQRGIAAAKAQSITNAMHALDSELSNLKRHTNARDENVPGRDRYDRTYKRVVAAAERVALATGKPVSGIPAWLPPPQPEPESTVTIGVPKPAAVTVTAMKDKGEALTSLPVFGSALDTQLRDAGIVK